MYNTCRQLVSPDDNLYPDQDRQSIGLDIDPNRFDTLTVFPNESSEKVNFENC